ncbi:MAG: methyl-accepting chemotaxis protein [Planctomycetota bacterium]
MVQNIRLRTKIWLGFASVTALLIGVAWAGWQGINQSSTGFTNYRELARDSNLCSSLQANMLMVRMNVKDFLITSDAKDVDDYNDYLEKAEACLNEAQREISKPERAKLVDSIEQSLLRYRDAFSEVSETQTIRNRILDDQLNTLGPQIERALTTIMMSARDDEDIEASVLAGTALRRLLLGRLSVVKYFTSKMDDDITRASSEFDQLDDDLKRLDAVLENPTRKALLDKVVSSEAKYRNAFDRLVQATRQRDLIVDRDLDQLGPAIAAQAESVKASVKKDQDALGPQLKSANALSRTTIAVVGIVAVALAIAISWVLSRMITTPIARLVTGIQNAESKRDLTVRFEANRNDEIGAMAKSLNKFFDVLHEAVSSVGGSSRTVSDASSELTDTALTLNEGADVTREQSVAADSAAQAMNDEMVSISQSTHEMGEAVRLASESIDNLSTSIREVAANADQASHVASNAASLTESSKTVVARLDESAAEIGKVVEVIEEIAEQTNLLALNATIEAARAGDAGKGFAVVADEVKDLAGQTAKATEGIRNRVGDIQASTGKAVDSIEEIAQVISQVDAFSSNIANAVDQQSKTTTAISKRMADTNNASRQVTAGVERSTQSTQSLVNSIAAVKDAARSTAAGAHQTRSAGESLAGLADEVKQLVSRFSV